MEATMKATMKVIVVRDTEDNDLVLVFKNRKSLKKFINDEIAEFMDAMGTSKSEARSDVIDRYIVDTVKVD